MTESITTRTNGKAIIKLTYTSAIPAKLSKKLFIEETRIFLYFSDSSLRKEDKSPPMWEVVTIPSSKAPNFLEADLDRGFL